MKVFPEHSLLAEEFVRVRQMASGHCTGEPGREKMLTLHPDMDFAGTVLSLEQTDELRRIFISGEQFPHQPYPDTRAALKLLAIRNSVLTINQFLEIAIVTNDFRLIHDFLNKRKEKYPLLAGLLTNTLFEPEILKSIDEVMDETGFVRNTASVELSGIRKQLSRKRAEADQVYQSVIQKYRRNGWLTDSEESWRSGRRVISVFAEQKRAVKGVIHDISSTGKTCFVEPEEAIGINTMVFELEAEEKHEILRILTELTSTLRKFHPLLQQYAEHVENTDVIAGKAKLALQLDMHLPFIENKPLLDVYDARHPLLYALNKQANRNTIPFSLKLEGEERILVISGPNAGGKTVCMKTIGLLQMLLQSGFLVTADSKSRFGFFHNLLIDIGDSQSLDYELSTYSSRLKNMKEFLDQADERTLFFIDEFGTGTDPALGGALAEAILEELNSRHSFGIITTHYMNLKVLADRTKGIINGSMAFDANRLVPLYRLEVGKPGSSYTFVVASRSGLSQQVINRARKKVRKNSLLLEELLNRMDREKAGLQKLQAENRNKQKQLDEMVKRYEKNLHQQEQRIEQDMERVRQKELRLINQMEDKFKRFVRDWREAKNKKTVLEKYSQQFVDKKNTLSVRDQQKLEEDIRYNISMIRTGSKVHLRNGKVTGVVESIEGTKVVVVFGNVRTLSDISNLVFVEEKKVK